MFRTTNCKLFQSVALCVPLAVCCDKAVVLQSQLTKCTKLKRLFLSCQSILFNVCLTDLVYNVLF